MKRARKLMAFVVVFSILFSLPVLAVQESSDNSSRSVLINKAEPNKSI